MEKIAKRIVFVCTLLFFVFSGTLFSQDVPKITIQGQVVDAETQKPLRYTDVFISNTTLGCATDESGNFIIKGIPVGHYDIVASMMGYEVVVLHYNLTEEGPKTFYFKLPPKVLEGERLEITASSQKQWKRDLKQFEKLFIGDSPNAGECVINNPEILDFDYDRKTKIFSAWAEEPLLIDNYGLGYHIQYYIIEFQYKKNVEVRYHGKVKYTPMQSENENDLKKWSERRREAYRGSMRHFLSSAFILNTENEGYSTFLSPKLPTKKNKRIFNEPVDIISMISLTDISYEKKLTFPLFLKIMFNPSFETGSSHHSLHMSQSGVVNFSKENKNFENSWIKMNEDFIIFNSAGFIKNPLSATVHGDWAWERIAEDLPYDYIP